MRYRQFGSTGIAVSEITFGAMRVTGDAAHVARSGPPTQAQVDRQNEAGRRALNAALDGGVNCIHSSDDYGTWWLLGDVLRTHPRRAEVHHVIKVTTPDYEEQEFSARRVREVVESALRSLHAERITFVQHLQRGPMVSKDDAYATTGDARRIGALPTVAAELQAVMDELRREGKVGHAITFPHTMGYARAAMSTDAYAGVAHFFNLVETEGLEILDDLAARGWGYFAIRPLLQGLLTDKRISRDRLPAGDQKHGRMWDTRYALLDRIRDVVGDRVGESWTTYALQFALAHPGVTSLVTSASDETQMASILEACTGEYPSIEDVRAVHSVVQSAGNLPKSDLFVENLVQAT